MQAHTLIEILYVEIRSWTTQHFVRVFCARCQRDVTNVFKKKVGGRIETFRFYSKERFWERRNLGKIEKEKEEKRKKEDG